MKVITVRLLLDVPEDAHAIDWVNETLREMQRGFTPWSDLIDYAIGGIHECPLDVENYQEGEAF